MKQQQEALADLAVPELIKIPEEVFRAYDIRGIVGQQLSTIAAYWIGRALGSEIAALGGNNIVTGFDGRISSPELHKYACRGLIDSGINVVSIGMCTSPMLYFACFHLEPKSGLMVTGSHNPPEYNGMKMLINQQTLLSSSIQSIRRRIEDINFTSGCGNYSETNILEQYINAVTSRIKLEKPLKVVIDCGNGVGGLVAESLFAKLGCEVIPIHCHVDGNFPGHHPDPSIADNLQDLQSEVTKNAADIGLAFDGDADRLGVVCNQGNIIWPDRQMMVFADYFLKQRPGDHVVFDVKCTKNLASYIHNAGGTPVMWKTGHSLIKAKMHELAASFSGEMSGHLFFGEPWFGFDDGIYAGALLCQLLTQQDLASGAWFARLPDSINTPEIKINISENQKFSFIQQLQQLGDFSGAQVNDIDGLRVEYNTGWGLVRASNTTPCLTLRFEADNEQELTKLQSIFKLQMLKVNPDLDLPF